MYSPKEAMIEEMEEARGRLEQALDDIESNGERFEWLVENTFLQLSVY